ncbi:ABC transporter ATP-binding protein [Streptomyces spiroverticillatus]|uniref:ABC transporter ATP-binding protein n=1 Tax=Streptomyces finlayi TaxID=67296 RepID=A0A919C9J1_9ACTN|nr:sn-glycerol-3-phosphate ABC transporter ATP-binding protein UgpC [Streptomyces finlayi]GHA07766.1 ABC transporter ATP-binding protein [Streptomyces spiroverticillatus]GHC90997.1 ABC transporter ATP-binding protein [Streptomyces finlayi]
MSAIELRDVVKTYPDGTSAVTGIDLTVPDGSFTVLVGPSGCGKSTLLRMVAGLEEITGGEVRIGDTPVNKTAAADRNLAMVFQNYALYPHMTVADNIAFGMRARKVPKPEREKRTREAAEILGLTPFLDRRPANLSGGQRQRVAMGRAIVRSPEAFLMDEPLSNLDAKLRVQMRAEISLIQRRTGTTTLYVTHDQTEAMTMGDQVVVMSKGRIRQVGSPTSLYDAPADLFVASFIGAPPMNLVRAELVRDGDALAVALGGSRLTVTPEVLARHPDLPSYAGREVVVGIRPEHLQDEEFAGPGREGDLLRAEVRLREDLGREVSLLVNPVPGSSSWSRLVLDDSATVEDDPTGAAATLTATVHQRTRLRDGDVASLRVSLPELHFFDPSTSLAISGSTPGSVPGAATHGAEASSPDSTTPQPA